MDRFRALSMSKVSKLYSRIFDHYFPEFAASRMNTEQMDRNYRNWNIKQLPLLSRRRIVLNSLLIHGDNTKYLRMLNSRCRDYRNPTFLPNDLVQQIIIEQCTVSIDDITKLLDHQLSFIAINGTLQIMMMHYELEVAIDVVLRAKQIYSFPEHRTSVVIVHRAHCIPKGGESVAVKDINLLIEQIFDRIYFDPHVHRIPSLSSSSLEHIVDSLYM